MQSKEKENKNKKKRLKKSWLIIAGSFLFVLGSGLLSFEYIEPVVEEHFEKEAIEAAAKRSESEGSVRQ